MRILLVVLLVSAPLPRIVHHPSKTGVEYWTVYCGDGVQGLWFRKPTMKEARAYCKFGQNLSHECPANRKCI
jgi:hypothetical protein